MGKLRCVDACNAGPGLSVARNGLLLRFTGMLFLFLLITGCSGPMNQNDPADHVRLLGQGDHCEQMEPGLAWWEATTASQHLPGALGSKAAEVVEAGNPVLAVFLGQRPTPGYSASLESVALDGARLRVFLEKTAPDPERMMAQVITTPCILLEVPAQGWRELEVILDAEGFPLRTGYPNTR